MKYTTLKEIEKLLKKEIKENQSTMEVIDGKIKELQPLKYDYSEEFSQEQMDYWNNRRNTCAEELAKAMDAIGDFLEHDWH